MTYRIETTTAGLPAARRSILAIGGFIVSSAPAGRGYVLHYVIREA